MKRILCLIGLVMATFSSAPKAENILLIGDSLLFGAFAKKIFNVFSAEGSSIAIYGGCGFSAKDWLKAKPVADCGYKYKGSGDVAWTLIKTGDVPGMRTLIERHRPERVIVQLGGNMYRLIKNTAVPEANGEAAEDMAAIKKLALGEGQVKRKCLWITPPFENEHIPQAKQLALATLAERVLEPECQVFRSYEPILDYYAKTPGLSPQRASEHPSAKVYGHWADLVIPLVRNL